MSKMLVSLCIALALASTSYGVVIGNWENAADTTFDGWNGGWQGSTYLDYSTNGATLGSQALLVSTAGEWGLQYAFPAPMDLTGKKLTFTVTMLPSDAANLTGWGAICADFVINSNGTSGWKQITWSGLVTCTDNWNPGQTNIDFGNWNPYTTNGFQKVYTIDLGGMGYDNTGATYEQFNFGLQMPNNTTLYFDNVQLTPEPATMALLGLGGLALIRRKK